MVCYGKKVSDFTYEVCSWNFFFKAFFMPIVIVGLWLKYQNPNPTRLLINPNPTWFLDVVRFRVQIA